MSNYTWVLGEPSPTIDAIESLLRECGQSVAYAVDEDGKRNSHYGCGAVYPDGTAVWDYTRIVNVGCCTCLADNSGRVSPVWPEHNLVVPIHSPPAEFLVSSTVGQVISLLARLGPLPTSWLRGGEAGEGNIGCVHPDRPGPHADYCVGRYCECDEADRPTGGYVAACRSSLFGGPRTGSWVRDGESWDWVSIPTAIVYAAAAEVCPDAALRGECPGVDPDAFRAWLESQQVTAH